MVSGNTALEDGASAMTSADSERGRACRWRGRAWVEPCVPSVRTQASCPLPTEVTDAERGVPR